jgi:hypothetical protein
VSLTQARVAHAARRALAARAPAHAAAALAVARARWAARDAATLASACAWRFTRDNSDGSSSDSDG